MAKTVLIVEDNELNMKLFHDLLEAHGIQTLETRSGLEVMDIARAKRPDLILMDIQLPEVSGLDVTKWLKADEELKHIPVIAVTAFAMKGDEEKIRQGGCEDYISKPISVVRFIEVIQTYLNKSENTKPVEAVLAQEPIVESSMDEVTVENGSASEAITTEENTAQDEAMQDAAPSFEIQVREDDDDEIADDFLLDDESGDEILNLEEADEADTQDTSKTTGDR